MRSRALRRTPAGSYKSPSPNEAGAARVTLCEPLAVESRSRVDLPSFVTEPYEVFVNGVSQVEGADYEVAGSSLVFNRSLAREGRLGFWRWLAMLLGIAGTYRKHDTIDVAFTVGGRSQVVSLAPVVPETDSP